MRICGAVTLFAGLYLPNLSWQQTCWHPDGKDVAESDTPCDPFASVSPCCGRDSYCMDNGLCYDAGSISRGSCTDQSWGEGCAQYCVNVPSCSDSGGCTVVVCDAWLRNFTCGYPTNCATGEDTFIYSGGEAIVLRPTQVALLEPNKSPSALTLAPTDILSVDPALKAAGTQSVLTVTATTTAASTPVNSASAAYTTSGEPSTQTFTAGQIAGAVAGTGIPLLCALAAACFIIVRQRKALRKTSGESHQPTSAVSYGQVGGQASMVESDPWSQQQRSPHNWSASTARPPSTTHREMGRPNEMEALFAQKVEMDTQQEPRELGSRQ